MRAPLMPSPHPPEPGGANGHFSGAPAPVLRRRERRGGAALPQRVSMPDGRA